MYVKFNGSLSFLRAVEFFLLLRDIHIFLDELDVTCEHKHCY